MCTGLKNLKYNVVIAKETFSSMLEIKIICIKKSPNKIISINSFFSHNFVFLKYFKKKMEVDSETDINKLAQPIKSLDVGILTLNFNL